MKKKYLYIEDYIDNKEILKKYKKGLLNSNDIVVLSNHSNSDDIENCLVVNLDKFNQAKIIIADSTFYKLDIYSSKEVIPNIILDNVVVDNSCKIRVGDKFKTGNVDIINSDIYSLGMSLNSAHIISSKVYCIYTDDCTLDYLLLDEVKTDDKRNTSLVAAVNKILINKSDVVIGAYNLEKINVRNSNVTLIEQTGYPIADIENANIKMQINKNIMIKLKTLQLKGNVEFNNCNIDVSGEYTYVEPDSKIILKSSNFITHGILLGENASFSINKKDDKSITQINKINMYADSTISTDKIRYFNNDKVLKEIDMNELNNSRGNFVKTLVLIKNKYNMRINDLKNRGN